MPVSNLRAIVKIATILALFILMLGAYTRLSNAGLGCPDWPGCYGQLIVPSSSEGIDAAQNLYPDKLLESGKAWIEMLHRYAAGILGFIILYIALVSIKNRQNDSMVLPLGVLVTVIFQALLGMWTVTKLVNPMIVTTHLLGGMITTALLWLLYLRLGAINISPKFGALRLLAWLGVILLFTQIALGGWVSTNYAALACVDFPGCHIGEFFPNLKFVEAFKMGLQEGVNFEGGVLDSDARATIHMMHRVGALVVTVFYVFLGLYALKSTDGLIRKIALWLLLVLALQVTLGISNVYFSLPLPLAVLHNGVGAILLLIVLSLAYYSKAR